MFMVTLKNIGLKLSHINHQCKRNTGFPANHIYWAQSSGLGVEPTNIAVGEHFKQNWKHDGKNFANQERFKYKQLHEKSETEKNLFFVLTNY
jgi:hypothetical protein